MSKWEDDVTLDSETEEVVVIEHRIAELWRTINDAAAAFAVFEARAKEQETVENVDTIFRQTLVYCINTIAKLQADLEKRKR